MAHDYARLTQIANGNLAGLQTRPVEPPIAKYNQQWWIE
jgi:hypothetical protein